MNYRNISQYVKTTVAAILIAQTALPMGMVQASSQWRQGNKDNLPVAAANAAQNTLLNGVLATVQKRYAVILAQIPADVMNGVSNERAAGVNAVVAEKIKGLKDGTLKVEDFREEMAALAQQSLIDQKRDIFNQLQSMPAETLDQLADTIKGNVNYADARQEYEAAYTRTEKANALSRAVYTDLDHLFSMSAKRSNFMTDKGFIQDLSALQGAYGTKDFDAKKWLTAIGLAVLGIAVTGLVTWGIATAVYKGKYDARVSQLDAHYNQVRSELEAHYQNLNNDLTADEQNYLAAHGFTYTTCATYQTPDSILCNRYNYQVFSGNKFCTVNCYKNPSTGQQTLQSEPVCTSPFIPADCYDPSEYTNGYNHGASDGHADGSHDGYVDGRYDGANDGYEVGYRDGKYDGYNDGYSDGFTDGYNSYYYKSLKSEKPSLRLVDSEWNVNASERAGALAPVIKDAPAPRGAFYSRGFQEGRRDAQNILKTAAAG